MSDAFADTDDTPWDIPDGYIVALLFCVSFVCGVILAMYGVTRWAW